MKRDTPLFFECHSDGWQHTLSERWGRCRRWIEVLDDQHAGRQIDFYDNGNVLMYDRAHEQDEYGCLIGLRFSWKAKWQKSFRRVRLLTDAEFEQTWTKTRRVVL